LPTTRRCQIRGIVPCDAGVGGIDRRRGEIIGGDVFALPRRGNQLQRIVGVDGRDCFRFPRRSDWRRESPGCWPSPSLPILFVRACSRIRTARACTNGRDSIAPVRSEAHRHRRNAIHRRRYGGSRTPLTLSHNYALLSEVVLHRAKKAAARCAAAGTI
jgi:hypothetical protein